MTSLTTFRTAISERVRLGATGLAAFMAVALVTGTALGATYYVDPQGGSDGAAGTSSGAAWESVPGSRTSNNAQFLRSQWGSVSTANKIKCGDTILLKGGATYSTTTVSNGGALRIDPSYYTDNCTGSTPITIRVASNTEWSGSNGHFTINGSGMLITSSFWDNNGSTCSSGGYCGLVAIEKLDGVVFAGLSNAQRIVLSAVTKSTNNSAKTSGVLVQGKGADLGKHVQLGWLDIANKSAYDNGYGIEITDLGLSWVHDVNIHDWQGGGVDTSMMTTWHQVKGLVIENVKVSRSGNTSTSAYPVSEGFYFAGAVFSDSRAGGGVWCVNCVSEDGFSDGANSFGCNSNGQDGLLRYRDSAFYGNGRNGASLAGADLGHGMESAGDGQQCSSAYSGHALPEQTILTIRTVFYNNFKTGLFFPHNGGSHYSWHDTFFRAGTVAQLMLDRCSANAAIFNGIVDAGSGGRIAWNVNTAASQCGTARTAPVIKNTFFHGGSANDKFTQFRTLCSTDNGSTFNGTKCSNGGCPSGQTCRSNTDYAHDVNCQPPNCPGQTYGDPPGFVSGAGDGNLVRAGSQTPQFVSTGGACDSDFVSGQVSTRFASCNLRLQAGSPAIDPATPVFVLQTQGSGSNSSVVTVKAGTPEPEQVATPAKGNYGSIGLGWGTRPHIGDPRTYFISPQNHPWATGDVIQIVGSCSNGASRFGAPGRARIVSMTSNSITLDDTCTWANNAGVHWPFSGSGPDMGAFEYGLDSQGSFAPVLISVEPVQ